MELKRWNSPYYSHRTVDGQPSYLIFRAGNFLESWITGTQKDIVVGNHYANGPEVIRLDRNGQVGFLSECMPSNQKIKELLGWFSSGEPVCYQVDGKRVFDRQDLPAFYLPVWARGRVWFITTVDSRFKAESE